MNDDPDTTALLERATAILTNECLRDADVAFAVPVPPPASDRAASFSPVVLWLPPSEAFGIAESMYAGATIPPEPPSTQPPDPDAYQAAMYGDPPERVAVVFSDAVEALRPVGGCAGQVTEELYGVPPADYERAYAVRPRPDEPFNTALADLTVNSSLESWSRCMRTFGHKADNPEEFGAEIAETVGRGIESGEELAALVDAERRFADADATCKASSGLGDAFSNAYTRAVETVLTNAEGQLIVFAQMLDHARAKAESVVNGS
jgi:hypothetical protein